MWPAETQELWQDYKAFYCVLHCGGSTGGAKKALDCGYPGGGAWHSALVLQFILKRKPVIVREPIDKSPELGCLSETHGEV